MNTSIEKTKLKEEKQVEKKVGLFKKMKQRISNITKTPKKCKKSSNDQQNKKVSQSSSINNISNSNIHTIKPKTKIAGLDSSNCRHFPSEISCSYVENTHLPSFASVIKSNKNSCSSNFNKINVKNYSNTHTLQEKTAANVNKQKGNKLKTFFKPKPFKIQKRSQEPLQVLNDKKIVTTSKVKTKTYAVLPKIQSEHSPKKIETSIKDKKVISVKKQMTPLVTSGFNSLDLIDKENETISNCKTDLAKLNLLIVSNESSTSYSSKNSFNNNKKDNFNSIKTKDNQNTLTSTTINHKNHAETKSENKEKNLKTKTPKIPTSSTSEKLQEAGKLNIKKDNTFVKNQINSVQKLKVFNKNIIKKDEFKLTTITKKGNEQTLVKQHTSIKNEPKLAVEKLDNTVTKAIQKLTEKPKPNDFKVDLNISVPKALRQLDMKQKKDIVKTNNSVEIKESSNIKQVLEEFRQQCRKEIKRLNAESLSKKEIRDECIKELQQTLLKTTDNEIISNETLASNNTSTNDKPKEQVVKKDDKNEEKVSIKSPSRKKRKNKKKRKKLKQAGSQSSNKEVEAPDSKKNTENECNCLSIVEEAAKIRSSSSDPVEQKETIPSKKEVRELQAETSTNQTKDQTKPTENKFITQIKAQNVTVSSQLSNIDQQKAKLSSDKKVEKQGPTKKPVNHSPNKSSNCKQIADKNKSDQNAQSQNTSQVSESWKQYKEVLGVLATNKQVGMTESQLEVEVKKALGSGDTNLEKLVGSLQTKTGVEDHIVRPKTIVSLMDNMCPPSVPKEAKSFSGSSNNPSDLEIVATIKQGVHQEQLRELLCHCHRCPCCKDFFYITKGGRGKRRRAIGGGKGKCEAAKEGVVRMSAKLHGMLKQLYSNEIVNYKISPANNNSVVVWQPVFQFKGAAKPKVLEEASGAMWVDYEEIGRTWDRSHFAAFAKGVKAKKYEEKIECMPCAQSRARKEKVKPMRGKMMARMEATNQNQVTATAATVASWLVGFIGKKFCKKQTC